MVEAAWQISHSVETDASHSFAWGFMTDVSNWDDPPARFALDGPFAAGSEGTTLLPGQEPIRWRIRDLQPYVSYTIQTELDGATLCIKWRFHPLGDRRTRLTQQIVLSGETAEKYVDGVRATLGPNLAPGMARIATAIAVAEAGSLR
jgi:hypothetical protein